MRDYIDEFLDGSSNEVKTYTIEEYLKEFVRGGDLVCITQFNGVEISGLFGQTNKYLEFLDPKIRQAELKKWRVNAPHFSPYPLCHFLSVLDHFSSSRERNLF